MLGNLLYTPLPSRLVPGRGRGWRLVVVHEHRRKACIPNKGGIECLVRSNGTQNAVQGMNLAGHSQAGPEPHPNGNTPWCLYANPEPQKCTYPLDPGVSVKRQTL